MKIKTLASRENGFWNLLRIGGTENEDDMARRFFDGFKKRIEGRRREHMHLVDDVDLPGTASWRVTYTADDFLTYIFNARTACGVQLVHIGVSALGDSLAFLAGSVRFDSGTLFAH